MKTRLVARAEVKEEQKDAKTERASSSKGEAPKRRVTFKEEPMPKKLKNEPPPETKKLKTETPPEKKEYQDRKPVATTGSQKIEEDLQKQQLKLRAKVEFDEKVRYTETPAEIELACQTHTAVHGAASPPCGS